MKGANYNGNQSNPAVAWVCTKAEREVFKALYESLAIPVKIIPTKDAWGQVSFWTFRVLDTKHFWRAREIRRGFKVSCQLRGDVRDFLEGLRAGLLFGLKQHKLYLPEAVTLAPLLEQKNGV